MQAATVAENLERPQQARKCRLLEQANTRRILSRVNVSQSSRQATSNANCGFHLSLGSLVRVDKLKWMNRTTSSERDKEESRGKTAESKAHEPLAGLQETLNVKKTSKDTVELKPTFTRLFCKIVRTISTSKY